MFVLLNFFLFPSCDCPNRFCNTFEHLEWLNKAALKNVQEAMNAQCVDQKDYKDRADTVLKAKEAVFGKTPDTAIQINNQQSVMTLPEYKQALKEALDAI